MLGALLVALAITAVSASAASAFTEFVGKNGVGTEVTSVSKVENTLKAEGPEKAVVTVVCKESTDKGTVLSKTDVSVVITYPEKVGTESNCTVAGLAAKVTDNCLINFLIDGTVDIQLKEKEASPCATIEVKSTGCKILITGNQEKLKGVTYNNILPETKFESEVKANPVTGIAFSTTTGTACGFKEKTITSANGASFTGTGTEKGVIVK